MASRVLVAGYYGHNNAGDEAILRGLVHGLQPQIPLDAITVASNDPESTEVLHGVHSVEISDLPELLRAVVAADTVIVGGGGLFQDYWGAEISSIMTDTSAGIPQFGAAILLAALLGKRSGLVGLGVGPLNTSEGRTLARELVQLADFISVRDRESRAQLEALNVDRSSMEVGADLAFLGNQSGFSAVELGHTNNHPLLAVAARTWPGPDSSSAWEQEVASAVDCFLDETGGRAVFVPMQCGSRPLEDDVACCERIQAEMVNKSQSTMLDPELDPLVRFDFLGCADVALTVRLHGAIAAARYGVPFVAIAYDNKVESLMNQLDLAHYSLPMTALDSENLLELLMTAHRNSGRLKDHLFKEAERARRGAHGSLQWIKSSDESSTKIPERAMALRKTIAQQLIERSFLEREAERLDSQVQQLRASNRKLENKAKERERELTTQIFQLRHQSRRIKSRLDEIQASKGWKLLSRVWHLIWRLRESSDQVERSSSIVSSIVKAIRHSFQSVNSVIDGALDLIVPPIVRKAFHLAGPAGFSPSNNSTVFLCSSDYDLWPQYEPRLSMDISFGTNVAVSVIATALNEGLTVERWITDIESQSYRPAEVIVVDGGSTDGTFEQLVAFAETSRLDVRVVRREGANIAEGRNVAVSLSENEYIAVTDFGCTLPRDWLENLVAPFGGEPEIDVIAGWYEARMDDTRLGSAIHELIPKLCWIDPAEFLPSSRSIAFSKSAWKACGGYPAWLTRTGEDTYFDLSLKALSLNWAFAPAACVLWHPPRNFKDWWRKLISDAEGDGESGAFARRYLKGLVMMVSITTIAFLLMAAVPLVAMLVTGSWEWALTAEALLLASLGLAGSVPLRERGPRLITRYVGQIARSIGFVSGVMRRPKVLARKYENVDRIQLIFTGVPMDDSGGGQRSAQLARTSLRHGSLVVHVSAFEKNESVDLGLKYEDPQLIQLSSDEFDAKMFLWEFGELLCSKEILLVIDFPLPVYLPMARTIHRAGIPIVYERIDNWNSSLGAAWYRRRVEENIVRLAAGLSATSPALKRDLEEMTGRSVELVPNGVDLTIFDRSLDHESPLDLPDSEFTMVYAGALWGDWFDWDLLVEVADAFHDAEIVVIGDYRGQLEGGPPNLRFLGLKAQLDLPKYFAHSDIGLIPWKDDEITRSTSPIKAYEYLAMGLPIVATNIEPLENLPYTFLANSKEEFTRYVHMARDLQIDGQRLDAFLHRNTWKSRWDRLFELAEKDGESELNSSAPKGLWR